MAIDYNRKPDARARAEGAGNAMVFIIGAAIVAAIIAMVMIFAFADGTPTGSTVTTPPASTAPLTQPQTVTPPANTTTPAPAPTPSTR